MNEQKAGRIACETMRDWQSGYSTWRVTGVSPEDDMWLVVLADQRSEHFATLLVTPDGQTDLVCVQDYTPANRRAEVPLKAR